jgi:hypothetical protein
MKSRVCLCRPALISRRYHGDIAKPRWKKEKESYHGDTTAASAVERTPRASGYRREQVMTSQKEITMTSETTNGIARHPRERDNLPFHPLADVLPLIESAEFDRLVADIREQGLLNPITVCDGKILDGRNRYRACRAAGVTPRYVEFDGNKTGLVWDKEIIGTGYWARNQHEHLLIAVKGEPPMAPPAVMPASVIRERRREHSRKPEASYAIIDRMYPDLPKLELFARQRRKGWDAWGNEVPSDEAPPHPLDIPACLRRAAS